MHGGAIVALARRDVVCPVPPAAQVDQGAATHLVYAGVYAWYMHGICMVYAWYMPRWPRT